MRRLQCFFQMNTCKNINAILLSFLLFILLHYSKLFISPCWLTNTVSGWKHMFSLLLGYKSKRVLHAAAWCAPPKCHGDTDWNNWLVCLAASHFIHSCPSLAEQAAFLCLSGKFLCRSNFHKSNCCSVFTLTPTQSPCCHRHCLKCTKGLKTLNWLVQKSRPCNCSAAQLHFCVAVHVQKYKLNFRSLTSQC